MIDFPKLSLKDALDLAILIEEEAQARYLEFTEQLGQRYQGDASDFFKMMASNEAKHAHQLSERRKKLFKNEPSKMTSDMIWDVEAAAPGKPRAYMSPRQALELAMESEVKAHNFFDEALKFIKDKEVRELFIELRGEELEHQKALQKQLSLLPASEGPDLSEDDVDEPPEL